MAENEPITPEAWNSPQLRRGILAKIQETLNSYGVTTNKSPAELERSVFQKANSKEQYLSFVARLIIHLKNNARPGMGVGGGAGGVQGPMGPGQHQQLNVMMQSGQGMPPQQMNLLQQQQAMHQNQQISALQQQQQQQQSIALQAQMKSQMGQQQQQQQQMQMQQSQMMAGASNGLTLNNMPGGGGGPNAPKMNPMMNAGGNEAHGSEQQQMANMMAMQKAKQLNSHLAPNASIATSNISIVNSNFNPQMTINSNVNSSLANMSSNLNASSNINSQSASASTITSILNSANMKPKLVPNMMAPNANANAGGNLNAPHSITLNQQSATQQLQQGPGGPATQMSLQQQIAQHQQQQQQQNRMMQPGATLVTNHGGMVPNARMMMSQPGIRQQGNQINIPANLQAQLRLRQVNPGGPNSLQMANLQQGNQSGTIPIYLQQQQQQSQHPANQNGPNQSLGNQEPKFFEITNVNQPNQRITPVTVSQAQFKSMNVSSAGGNFVQTFNTSTLANAQQPQIVVSNSASMNALPGGIMSHSAAANNAANQMPPNLASQLSQQQQNKLNQAGSMGPQGVSSAQQVQAQAGNKLLSVPTPNTLLSSQNMNNIHSPSNFHINSPASVQSVPMMSPAGRATNSTIGAPSPQSALNTPASPGQAATPAQKTAAEQAYAEKLKSMQKYLQPLLNLISLLEKDERKAKELDRTRNLYCILVSQKKTSLDFLEKCELALEKMEREDRFVNRMGSLQAVEASPGMSSIPSVPAQTPANQQTAGPGAGPNVAGPTAATSQPPTSGTTTTAPGAPSSNRIQDICKPLIDAVIANYDRPLFSHTLARTFGPALAVLHHEPYSVSNRVNLSGNYVYYSNTDPPRPKRKPSPEVQAAAIRNEVLQGEIARLDVRFNVQPLIPGKRSLGPSRAQHLLCRLDDLDLPCVPPIKVYVSELYPDIPPHYSLERADYQSSAFFLQLYTFFRENLFNMTANYTLTALLLCWERSVRQAVCHDMEPSRGLKVAKVVDKENVRVSTPKIQIIN